MKKIFSTIVALLAAANMMAQGWPSGYDGVMLQGFYWDSYTQSAWKKLESRAFDFKGYFDLVWVPQSGKTLGETSMGYDPYYYFNQNSSFGTADELKSMISTFKAYHIGTIADVVVNHHNTNGWWTFPAETYKGTTYQFQTTDIVANDDQNKTAAQAKKDDVTLSSNNDEGEDWVGERDLDHKSSNVNKIIKAYESFLVNDMGYTGFRYDMVKGFGGSHVADYNDAAGVKYSVGEYWDSNDKIEAWINSTSKESAAFDFQFRYNVRDAVNNNDWTKLNSTNNLVHDATYRQYAVTFVENHDTQYRSSSEPLDPIKKDTLAANAYLLAMPGTPCVFYKHYLDYPYDIKAMIDARKAAGITNTSRYSNIRNGKTNYANDVVGSKGTLRVQVGSDGTDLSGAKYTKILSGYHYAYYLSNSTEVPFADKPSGNYADAFNVTLTAVSATNGAKLVYTTDGSTPTTSHGKQVASGSSIAISNSCTLIVGLLVNGSVTKTITRDYIITPWEDKAITVYVNASNAGSNWSTWTNGINFWTWGGNDNHAPANKSWPGDRISTKKTENGKTWITKSFTLTSEDDFVNFVFSLESGSPQTVNLENITDDTFVEIQSSQDGSGHYKISTTSASTGISKITTTTNTVDAPMYNLAGQRVDSNYKGVVIQNGKKVVRK